MLQRAWEMQIAIEKWLDHPMNQTRYQKLQVNAEEWNHIKMLLAILKPFSQITTAIGRTLTPTIHEPFRLYNYLFDKLEESEKIYSGASRRSQGQGRNNVANAIQAARQKLSGYYGQTGDDGGKFYGIATVLTPWIKLNLFHVSKSDTRRRYKLTI